MDATEETLPSLLEALQRIPDFRHAQGRRHKLATVLAIRVLARLAGKVGCDATARYAKTMSQEHLAALDARQDRINDLYIPPSRATIHRVMVQADSDEVQAAANRWAQAHPVPDRSALAADGKRINGVNRSGAVHHETATLVTHAEGIPIACRMCHEPSPFQPRGGAPATPFNALLHTPINPRQASGKPEMLRSTPSRAHTDSTTRK